MDRLITALEYYSLLNIMDNKNHQDKLRYFMNEKYRKVIDDYIHFKEYHQNELQQIHEDLINDDRFNKCDITQCQCTKRHHINDDVRDIILDPTLDFHIETMDSIHFHLFHSFDIGLRTKMNENDNKMEDFDEENTDKYFDDEFARINKRILECEDITASFDRFKSNNTKYNISIGAEEHEYINNDNDDDISFFDAMIKHLIEANVDDTNITILIDFVNEEDFDSDAIEYDHGLNPNGNITPFIKDQQCLKECAQFVEMIKISGKMYSIGLRYYYWIYYKDIIEGSEQCDNIKNLGTDSANDHSGHRIKDLYITPKYSSFKEEIANFAYITFKKYNEKVVLKVMEFLKSETMKRTTAFYNSRTEELHYDIKEGEPIRFHHLIAVVLYTDWTDLSTHFSSTFRQKHRFESLNSLKKRNREYYWMSKHLRECVEIYGQRRSGDNRYNENGTYEWNLLRGPFYSGMNIVMHIPAFNLRLCAPTSTSKQIEVAMKFSGVEGIVLQLNNSNVINEHLSAFNASWISKYAEEDERLFFGGYDFITLDSVRLRSTKQNFENSIYSLWYLDSMLIGRYFRMVPINENHIRIINDLFNIALNKQNKETVDDYALSTFDAFIQNTKDITLSLCRLTDANSNLVNLLMHRMHWREHIKETEREETDLRNLFRTELLQIFKNIQTITIFTNFPTPSDSWSLSLIGLLLCIETSSVKQVIVKAMSDKENNNFNWINNLWCLSGKHLQKEYAQKNYNISVDKEADKYHEYWCFVINRIY